MKLRFDVPIIHWVAPDRHGHYPEAYGRRLVAAGLATEVDIERSHKKRKRHR